MDDTIYNSIGTNYNTNRKADSRIVYTIKELSGLKAGSTIADIGAGTGNYSNALADLGYKIIAVEPSQEMRMQARPNDNVSWLDGTAEAIPLPDNSVNGVMLILSIHHFNSLRDASKGIHRICLNGPVVVFTLDPREADELWFKYYFPEIHEQDFHDFPPIDTVADTIAINGKWEIVPFPLPADLTDRNMYSAWNEPERYFDEQYRQNTSGLAKADHGVVEKGLAKLKADLESGVWDEKYGYLRDEKEFDAGFRFLKFAR